MRMTSVMFDILLTKVGLSITKMETGWRIPILAAARLAMTIWYVYIYNLDIFQVYNSNLTFPNNH